MKTRNFDKRIFILIGLVAFIGFLSLTPKQRFMINVTESVPIGLYFMEYNTSIRTGDMIAFLPAGDIGAMMWERGYVADNTPLIKVVAGTEGDQFCVDANRTFTINEKIIGESLPADSKGQLLPQLNGCATVSRGNYLVIGFGKRSFDSRYFGPISEKFVLAKLKPILTKSTSD